MTDCGTTYRSLPMLNIWNSPPGPSAVLRITAACWRPSGVVETVTMSPVTSVTCRDAATATSAGAALAPPATEVLPAKTSAATMTTLNMRRATVNLPTWARGCAASDAPKPIRSCAVPMWRLSDIAGTSQIKRYMVSGRFWSPGRLFETGRPTRREGQRLPPDTSRTAGRTSVRYTSAATSETSDRMLITLNVGSEPIAPPMIRMASQIGLVSLSTAGNAAALRVRQSTMAQTRSATKPQYSTQLIQK